MSLTSHATSHVTHFTCHFTCHSLCVRAPCYKSPLLMHLHTHLTSPHLTPPGCFRAVSELFPPSAHDPHMIRTSLSPSNTSTHPTSTSLYATPRHTTPPHHTTPHTHLHLTSPHLTPPGCFRAVSAPHLTSPHPHLICTSSALINNNNNKQQTTCHSLHMSLTSHVTPQHVPHACTHRHAPTDPPPRFVNPCSHIRTPTHVPNPTRASIHPM